MLKALLIYLGAAVVFTWPLVLRPTSQLAASQGPGDPYLNLWILGWDLRVLTTSPSALFSGRIFEANIFFPAADTLAYSDHQILQAIVLWPLYLLTRDLVLCYNALFFFSLVACALAMHLFARAVTGSTWGAYAAGIAWGFGPFHFAHLIHLQLQALYFLPLSMLFLHRFMAGRRTRDAVWLGLMAGLQAISSVYFGVIGSVGLLAALVALAITVGRWTRGGTLWKLSVAAFLAGLLAGPFAWPYWRLQQREGFARNLAEAARGAAAPSSYLWPPSVNLLYGDDGPLARALGRTRRLAFDTRAEHAGASPTGREGPERQLFPGLTVVGLAILGLWRAPRGGSLPLAAAMAAMATVGFALSLGPDGLRGVYSALHRTIFGLHAIRAPARFAVLLLFAVAVLAALGVRELIDRPPVVAAFAAFTSGRRRFWLASAALGLLALECANAPIPYVTAPSRRTPVGEWLRAAPEPGAVAHLPLGLDLENTPFMLQSLEHGRPIVNGYSGQRPPFYSALAETLQQFPSSESLRALNDLGVRYVVVSEPAASSETARSPLIARARLTGGTIYELRWTPAAEEDAARVEIEAAPPPPAPGPPPFGRRESATYALSWTTGPLGLVAGEAVLTVGEPERSAARHGAAAAYRFSLDARTAAWVSRFFEADDRFATDADGELLPLLHEQHLREGRRRLDRRIVFDRERRRLTVTTGAGSVGQPVSLPLSPHARDPLTAFFYARTLPLEPGFRARVPVNDAGRSITLDLIALEIESIEHRGQLVVALRVEPRLIQRFARRAPLAMTAWLSRDGRRIPLRVDVAGGFGVVRAELISYRAQ